jgi:hypothetical protein
MPLTMLQPLGGSVEGRQLVLQAVCCSFLPLLGPAAAGAALGTAAAAAPPLRLQPAGGATALPVHSHLAAALPRATHSSPSGQHWPSWPARASRGRSTDGCCCRQALASDGHLSTALPLAPRAAAARHDCTAAARSPHAPPLGTFTRHSLSIAYVGAAATHVDSCGGRGGVGWVGGWGARGGGWAGVGGGPQKAGHRGSAARHAASTHLASIRLALEADRAAADRRRGGVGALGRGIAPRSWVEHIVAARLGVVRRAAIRGRILACWEGGFWEGRWRVRWRCSGAPGCTRLQRRTKASAHRALVLALLQALPAAARLPTRPQVASASWQVQSGAGPVDAPYVPGAWFDAACGFPGGQGCLRCATAHRPAATCTIVRDGFPLTDRTRQLQGA